MASELSHVEKLLAEGKQADAEQELRSILQSAMQSTSQGGSGTAFDDAETRNLEQSLYILGRLYRDQAEAGKLALVIEQARPLMVRFAKAKTSKIVRTLLDYMAEIPESTQVQIDTIRDNIAWSAQERRAYLRQTLETRLVALYLSAQQYNEALTLIGTLLKQLKRLDDKLVLVEVHLLESRIYHAIRNIPKARGALTSARTNANAIYVSPALQAGLDMQSGILHAEDKDFRTAYSYFYEALEGYSQQQNSSRAIFALKYMLLSLIMLNQVDDLRQVLGGKLALKYQGRHLEAMRAVAKAHEERSLATFEQALQDYRDELQSDPIIRSHFSALYDTMLEQNLVRVIEPFSRVEIQHIADVVGLSVMQVEGKLSQMILDKVFHGVLDQGAGCLNVYPEPQQDQTYESALKVIKHMSNVVDLLVESKAARLIEQ